MDSGALMTPTVLNAVNAQAQSLWVTGAIVAVAGVATLGQVLSRIGRISEVDRRRLVALGATRAHTVGAAVGHAAVPAASGLVAGAVVAVLLSMLFPMGFVRELEPHTGIDVDVSLFIGLGVLVLGLLLGWVAAAAWIAQRRRPAERPSGRLEALATSTASAPAGAGIRFAYLRNERGAGSVTGAVAGLTAAMVGLMAAAVFGLSLDRFVDDGGRYGNNFDLMLGNGWLPAPTDLRSVLERDQDIEGLMLLGAGTARSGEATVELVGVESVRGGLVPSAPGVRRQPPTRWRWAGSPLATSISASATTWCWTAAARRPRTGWSVSP